MCVCSLGKASREPLSDEAAIAPHRCLRVLALWEIRLSNPRAVSLFLEACTTSEDIQQAVSSGGSQSTSKPPYYGLLPMVQGFKLVSSPPEQVRREKWLHLKL